MSPEGKRIEKLQGQRVWLNKRIATLKGRVAEHLRLAESNTKMLGKAMASLVEVDANLDKLLDEKLSTVVSVDDPQWTVEREAWVTDATVES